MVAEEEEAPLEEARQVVEGSGVQLHAPGSQVADELQPQEWSAPTGYVHQAWAPQRPRMELVRRLEVLLAAVVSLADCQEVLSNRCRGLGDKCLQEFLS